ncbi:MULTISPECIES: LLM class flavin-dependent oxidoreductase [Bradyrhizobium]|uniref:Monooxygenase n=3 Tax=Bradyrhizobium TaxID=374 RepID=A0A410VIU3_9BRAD|nr:MULTISPECIES: LLM class flavin-dependent oxidoreductase [Bradyrhizobium]MCG2628026.1 LLM class flavin-dependent oxidoreductase [Bradyrhizobium zhengyangense]MCG2643145.1 LLM class flavin-dependent oxidoreductase [Bradyrhizobium zhengyangense]MCG2670541.1 LLM class flavin-dependent oxidoreductase [Bradyrhizobium zhengyangense]MDN4985724.1 LLM class flavin-dependent oxidoreductase [Bradyrhizobium sp. WYCCWR 13022]MDT4736565.1 LLM class flavin-dependent oxidoreductase [Bradyrhizobium sp. WYCCW
MAKEIAFAALIHAAGSASAAWRHPDTDPKKALSLQYYTELAKLCEAGRFDLMFLADSPGVDVDNLHAMAQWPRGQNVLEPLTLLSALAASTEELGLGATVSASFTEPFNIARQFASLDHLSGGRAAWNVVTTANQYSCRNYGYKTMPPHDERYARAREALEVVRAYWDTWDDDAFIFDKARAMNFDPNRFHHVRYEGKHFKVQGGLNIARAPQGQPVIIQAGASSVGREFAAETAEVVFGTGATLEEAASLYKDIKSRMAKYRRDPSELKVLAGFRAMVGSTEAEAKEKLRLLNSVMPIEAKVAYVSTDLEVDLSKLPLDELVPEQMIPTSSNLHQGYFNILADMIRSRKFTLREIAQRYERGFEIFCGTPSQIADEMERWIDNEAGDGFMITFPYMPTCLEDFVSMVVPVLQERGLMRKSYRGKTLRENLGLRYPKNVNTKRPATGVP